LEEETTTKKPHGRNFTNIGGGDHDRRPHGNSSIIGGGDHDRKPHGRNFTIVGNSSIIGGGDHDRRPHGRNFTISEGNKEVIKISKLIKKLKIKNIDELRNYALALENYANSKKPGMIGGAHDYIMSMDSEACIQYIIKIVFENKELMDESAFLKVVEQESPLIFLAEEPIQMDGGLHDYIYRTDRVTLVKWALTAEKYYLTTKNMRVLGGLHDRIRNMTDLDIIEYILNKANEYHDLNSADKLNALASTYGITAWTNEATY